MLIRAAFVILGLIATLMLGGCSYFGSSSEPGLTAGSVTPASQIYADADALLDEGRFEKAAKRFEDVEREHPYSPEARRALAMAAYSYHKAEIYDKAISTGKRYTAMHPGTKEASLAQYIVASSYFARMGGPARDQTYTRKALKELRTFVRRYPDHPKVPEAQNRIRIAEDSLAAAEMSVGRYYLKRENYGAAINRFKTVIRDYQQTTHVEEALHRLTES